MKYILFVFTIFFIASGCRENKELTSEQQSVSNFQHSSQLATDRHAAYQAFIPGVKFITQVDRPEKPTTQLIKEQKAFIETSGLPDMTSLSEWFMEHTPSEAVTIYVEFAKTHQGHEYLPTFLQYQGWLILTRLHLLSNGKDDQIYTVLQKMVEAKYRGYGVIDYTLSRLEENRYDKVKLAAIAQTVLQYAPNVNKNTAPSAVSLTKVPPFAKKDIEEGVNKYLQKEADDRQYIEQIRRFINN